MGWGEEPLGVGKEPHRLGVLDRHLLVLLHGGADVPPEENQHVPEGGLLDGELLEEQPQDRRRVRHQILQRDPLHPLSAEKPKYLV